jgi:DNA repair photolyase
MVRSTSQQRSAAQTPAVSTGNTVGVPFRVHEYPLRTAIHRTPKFAKKGLADFSVNVGLKCAHACTYCSSASMLRCHAAFQAVGESPFKQGYAIVDPDLPDKIVADSKRLRSRGVVQLCTTVDAWCPAAQQYDLGRRCLDALLADPGWIVRILTKSTTVAQDFDLIERHRERVLVGLSLTGTHDKDAVLAVTEPNASPVSQRMQVLREAHDRGLRTYGMLCPLLPGVADSPEQVEELVAFLRDCGAEEVFAEAVNPRGPGLKNTQEALQQAGFDQEAEAVAAIRRAATWSTYAATLIRNLQEELRRHEMIEKLRFLLYPKGLQPADRANIEAEATGVVWL